MSARYLGPEFDIHGGGLDLRFPHHENELAQSRAAGDAFARCWVHSGLVKVSGQKMSKSLGNSILTSDWLDRAPAIVVRYALSTAHYRSDIDVHDGALEEAARAFDRITGFLERAGGGTESSQVPDEFAAAMDDDLSIPQALAVLHEAVRHGNQALDEGDVETAGVDAQHVRGMLECLGLHPHSAEWMSIGSPSGENEDTLDRLVDEIVTARDAAREAKNFGLADALRDIADQAGIEFADSRDGTGWTTRGR